MTGTSGKASICCLRYLLQWGTTGTSGKTLGDDGDVGGNIEEVGGDLGDDGDVGEGFNLLPEVPAAMGDDGDIGESFNLLPEVPAAVGDDGDIKEDTRG